MFFPDMQLAADEMYRVLKPGGKIATSVWAGPSENTWITTVISVINKNLQVPPPPQGAPGMFRCAAPSLIKTIMEKSGFRNVKEQLVSGKVLYEDFNQMWGMMNEVAAPVVGALSKADDAMKQKIRSEVQQLAEQGKTSQGIEMDYASWVISGDK
jgi:ubiquinone/menaquinone biosynthesis C-methylase UbiE